MSGIEFVFALFELAFFFGDLLLEDHLHFGFHLGQLLLVQGTLLLLLDGRVDLLEDAGVLGNTHKGELLGPVVLVQEVVRVLLEFFHVGTDQHLAQLDKVTVLLVVDLDDTPGVATATDTTTVSSGDLGVGTNNSKGNLGHDLLVLSNGLLVVKLVAGAFEDLEGVLFDIGKDLEESVCTASIDSERESQKLTRCLKRATSSSVKVSALAMTGIKLTLVCRRRITSISRGFREWPVGWMK